MQSPGSTWRCNPRFLFIVKEKISEKGPFFDESNKYKFIYVPQGIFSKKTCICDEQCFLIFSRESLCWEFNKLKFILCAPCLKQIHVFIGKIVKRNMKQLCHLGFHLLTKGLITWRISARARGPEIFLRLHDEFQPGLKYCFPEKNHWVCPSSISARLTGLKLKPGLESAM